MHSILKLIDKYKFLKYKIEDKTHAQQTLTS